MSLHQLFQDNLEEQTADGAMFQFHMKMDVQVLDVLMLEMIHGIVEINMIPLPAHQDGLVIHHPENVLWLIQEMDLEVNQLVKITVLDMDHTQVQDHMMIPIDAILQLVSVRNALMPLIQDVDQIDLLNATTVNLHHQIQLININATKLMKLIQNVRNVQMTNKKDAIHKLKFAKVAIQSKNFSNVIQRHSLVFKLNNKVISNKLVMLSADTSPHKSSSVPGEVLWLRKVKQQILTWVKLI